MSSPFVALARRGEDLNERPPLVAKHSSARTLQNNVENSVYYQQLALSSISFSEPNDSWSKAPPAQRSSQPVKAKEKQRVLREVQDVYQQMALQHQVGVCSSV